MSHFKVPRSVMYLSLFEVSNHPCEEGVNTGWRVWPNTNFCKTCLEPAIVLRLEFHMLVILHADIGVDESCRALRSILEGAKP